MELMPNQVRTLLVQNNHKWLKLMSLILALGVPVTLALLNYFGVINLPYLPSKPSLTQAPPSPFTLDTCQVKKEGNPLVVLITPTPTGIQGQIRGKVVSIEYDQILDSYKTKLVSLDGKQDYDFQLINQPGLGFDNATQKEIPLSDLKSGQTILLSFSCETENNFFKFTGVVIEGTSQMTVKKTSSSAQPKP